jgi:hypothetical protein
MSHDHGIRIGGALLVAVMMAASSLLMAAPALAQTKKAYAQVDLDGACCNAGGAYYALAGYISVTVGSTPSTPSVMIPYGVITRKSTYTWVGPATPFSINYIDARNGAATFKKSHSLAPTMTTTVNAADKVSSPANGGTFYMPRYGTLRQTPGKHRFGGTMLVVSDLHAVGQFRADQGYYDFYLNAAPTPKITGPIGVGAYGLSLTGMLTHTSISYKGKPLAFDGPAFATLMPSTTGTQYLRAPFGVYVTTYTYAGYDNRTPSGLHGTLSLVRPTVLTYFLREDGPPPIAFAFENQGFMARNTITFLPEPRSLLMLGCGILTLAGLFRLRMR